MKKPSAAVSLSFSFTHWVKGFACMKRKYKKLSCVSLQLPERLRKAPSAKTYTIQSYAVKGGFQTA